MFRAAYSQKHHGVWLTETQTITAVMTEAAQKKAVVLCLPEWPRSPTMSINTELLSRLEIYHGAVPETSSFLVMRCFSLFCAPKGPKSNQKTTPPCSPCSPFTDILAKTTFFVAIEVRIGKMSRFAHIMHSNKVTYRLTRQHTYQNPEIRG